MEIEALFRQIAVRAIKKGLSDDVLAELISGFFNSAGADLEKALSFLKDGCCNEPEMTEKLLEKSHRIISILDEISDLLVARGVPENTH